MMINEQVNFVKLLKSAATFSVAALFGFNSIAVAAQPAAPQIFWASAPVQSNDTVLLAGDNPEPVTAVRIGRLKDSLATTAIPPTASGEPAVERWQEVKPVQASQRCTKFIIPATWKNGIFACRVMAGLTASRAVLVNAPDPWWLQADAGDIATPGGWLRIFGRCLNFGGASQVALKPASGKTTVLKATHSDGYSLSCQVPMNLPAGRYNVSVHNGFGGNAGWGAADTIEIKTSTPWPTQMFNVMDFYGADAGKEIAKTQAKGAPSVDRTQAIQAALKKAEANGGGIVYFPEGKYAMQGEIKVPPRTVLRGAGMGLVTLWWGKGGFALDGGSDVRRIEDADQAIPATLMSGTQFGLEDMSLYLPREYQTGITTGDGFEMHHVRVRVDRYWVRSGQRENEVAFRLGNNCRVTDCDILSQGVAFMFNSGHDEIIARNKIMAGKSQFALERSDGVIVEDNDLVSLDPTAYINLSGEGRNVYYARNQHSSFFAHQSDFSWTFDGNGGAYFGKIATVNGTQVTLDKDPTYPNWAPEQHPLWRRSVLCIMDGKGTGQYRYITVNTGRTWQLDRPFDVPPDNSSTISIFPFRGRVLVIGNRFEDAGWVNMGYGSSFDVVCANNSLYRVGALLNLGLREASVHASWFIQYLNNDLYEGQTLEQTTGDLRNPEIFSGTTTRYAIHRGDHIHADNSGNINIGGNATDAIVEHCTVENAHSSIVAEKDTAGVLFRDNSFGRGAVSRYSGSGLDKAVVAGY
ncbi:MAG: hypothetical protein JO316_13625 [Abitibacteriaceae bacterium]|nr:hypothetical protein [Abditibacteriaceae bacterium]